MLSLLQAADCKQGLQPLAAENLTPPSISKRSPSADSQLPQADLSVGKALKL
jgi:hypothetical protein